MSVLVYFLRPKSEPVTPAPEASNSITTPVPAPPAKSAEKQGSATKKKVAAAVDTPSQKQTAQPRRPSKAAKKEPDSKPKMVEPKIVQ
jgi:hypothetical protein